MYENNYCSEPNTFSISPGNGSIWVW
jgi:hypothetical protein